MYRKPRIYKMYDNDKVILFCAAFIIYVGIPFDKFDNFHNAPLPYPKMFHFVTGMCTHEHISVTK